MVKVSRADMTTRKIIALTIWTLPYWLSAKEFAYNARDMGSIPGSGRSLGEGNGNPLRILAWRIPWKEEPGRIQSMG